MNIRIWSIFILIFYCAGTTITLAQTVAEKRCEVAQNRREDGKLIIAGQTGPVSMKLERGGRVSIRNQIGSIKITGWERDDVEAQATGEDGLEPIQVEMISGQAQPCLMLSCPARGQRGAEIDLEVKLPRYAQIESVTIARGDIEIKGIEGAIKASSSRGDIYVDGAGSIEARGSNGRVSINGVNGSASAHLNNGDLVAKNVKGNLSAKLLNGDANIENVQGLVNISTTSGSINVFKAGGNVQVVSLSDSISVKDVKGRVEANSASGSIELSDVGEDIDAATVSGDVTFTGAIRANGRYRLKSVSGEVLMVISPDSPGFTAHLSSYSGDIETDFTLTLESPVQINRRVTGRFGDGQAQITLDSFSGTVKLSKARTGTTKERKKDKDHKK
ncbi:MAG: DUF4097 family beta strand repeat-containing protein [Acidobacteriota bacterium]